MRPDVERDLTDSAYDFARVVWPAIRPWLGGGEVTPVESVTSEGFQKDLDAMAGIDAWHIMRDQHAIRGIASRVQSDGNAWNTFTIRLSRNYGRSFDTEYRKRLHALQNAERGFLLPHVTAQAYLSAPRTGQLMSVAMARTSDLFRLAEDIIERGAYSNVRDIRGKPLYGKRSTGGEGFLWIAWDLFPLAGVTTLKRWPDTREATRKQG